MGRSSSAYQHRYYMRRKSELLARRKRRYAEDTDYRESVKARARVSYHKKKNSSGKKRGRFFTARALANAIGRSPSTIREYHSRGVIPEVQNFHPRGWRHYTAAQIGICSTAFGLYDDPDDTSFTSLKDVKRFLKFGWEDAGNDAS